MNVARLREWQYKNITPRILVEKLIIDGNNESPSDFKVHCFHGEPTMIQVDRGRGTKNHFRNWYNIYWEREPYSWSSLYKDGKITNPSGINVEKPKQLEEMLLLSKKLANYFKYVRVDWYISQGKIYFGELTFHHDSGFRPIIPFKYDLILGDKLKINQ